MSSAAVSQVETETTLPVHPGQVLEGKFRVERVIGEGAMGMVMEATHLDLDERVALKFLHREAREKPEIVSRFAREARAAAKIASDHVARVYDVGFTDDGTPFIVMEFLEGMDLETLIARTGPLGISDAVDYVIQACEGLSAAHAIGIVHRDIKPANLYRVERAGAHDVKLLDFGISKAGISGTFEDIDLSSSNTTQIMGSPHYMSPEQIRSTKDVDARADLWSLGIVLYELLTGTMPFDGTDVTGIIAKVLHDPHRKIRTVRPDVPAELEAIVDRCLEKEVAGRYQSAAELALALVSFAPKRSRAVAERAAAMTARASGRLVVDSLPPSSGVGATSSVNVTARTEFAPAIPVSPAPPPRPVLWIGAAAIVLALLGGGAFVFASRSPQAAKVDPSPITQPTATTTTVSGGSMPATDPPSLPGAGMAPAPSASATPTVSASASTPTPSNPAKPVVRAQPQLQPQPRGAKPATSAAPSPETDIRHER